MCNVSNFGTYKKITNFEYPSVLPGTYIFSEINITSWKHGKMVLTYCKFWTFAYEFNSFNEESKR
jgi:hypothetical protein